MFSRGNIHLNILFQELFPKNVQVFSWEEKFLKTNFLFSRKNLNIFWKQILEQNVQMDVHHTEHFVPESVPTPLFFFKNDEAGFANSDWTRSDQIGSDQIRSGSIRSDPVRSDQNSSVPIRVDQTR